MIDLIEQFTLPEISFFTIFLLVALKEIISIFDFFYKRIKKYFDKDYGKDKEKEDILNRLSTVESQMKEQKENQKTLLEEINKIDKSCKENFKRQESILNLLIKSDRDDIKCWIIKEYHHFMEEQKWIDDFSLDSIEKRLEHYKAEGGDSYLEDIVAQLRLLPKHPPKQ